MLIFSPKCVETVNMRRRAIRNHLLSIKNIDEWISFVTVLKTEQNSINNNKAINSNLSVNLGFKRYIVSDKKSILGFINDVHMTCVFSLSVL